ncbi:MAG: redoxin domain-containing protein [Kofleriaceae bacterium]
MLAPGSAAAPFQLESTSGEQVSLRSLAGQLVVLYFYPRDNTPGCTVEAQDFRDHLSAFADAGAVVFGVSRDSIASHHKFRDKHALTFPLLTDPDGSMMARYQAWGEKSMYGKKVVGVIRSTVLIDRRGKIARHWPKVNVKGHAAAVLASVRELAGGEGGVARVPPGERSPRQPSNPPTRKVNPMKLKTPAKKAPAKTPVKKAPAKTPVKKAAVAAAPAPAKTPVKKAPAKTPAKKSPAKRG